MAGKCQKKLRATARFLSAFFRRNNKLHGGLPQTVVTKRPKSYNLSCRNKRPNPRYDFARHCKGENCDVSISNIILRTDNKKFNQKVQEVNTHLKDICKDKNIYLIDNTNKIKAQHLNKGKLHLNKRG